MQAWGQRRNTLPSWQAHMGSVCVCTPTFFVSLFLLEYLETGSRETAWRSSAPWLPLAGIAALAAAVHIPLLLVLAAASCCATWAYRRTCRVRRAHAPRRGRDTA